MNMTFYWCIPEEIRFAWARIPFDCITAQNRKFIAGLDDPTFDRGTQMDATRNNATMYIQDATEFICIYPQGSFPMQLADEMVETSRELLRCLARDYPPAVLRPLEHAYNRYFGCWYGANIQRVPEELFAKRLFESMNNMLEAIDTFNVYVATNPVPKTSPSGSPAKASRAYKTRANISFKRAAELSGFTDRTIKNLEKDPKNSGYPGRNVPEHAFLAWALGYQLEKVKKHWANMMNHPIPVSDLPPFLREKLAL